MTMFLPTAVALALLADTSGSASDAERIFDRMVRAGTIKPWPDSPGWWEMTLEAVAQIKASGFDAGSA